MSAFYVHIQYLIAAFISRLSFWKQPKQENKIGLKEIFSLIVQTDRPKGILKPSGYLRRMSRSRQLPIYCSS